MRYSLTSTFVDVPRAALLTFNRSNAWVVGAPPADGSKSVGWYRPTQIPHMITEEIKLASDTKTGSIRVAYGTSPKSGIIN